MSSIPTTADHKIFEAREHAHKALMALNAIVIEQCEGHADYRADFSRSLEKAHQLAQRLRNILQ